MPSLPPRRDRNRFTLQLEQLEDRCVPTTATSGSIGSLGTVSAVAQVGASAPGIPSTVAKTVALAQKNATSLHSVLSNLSVAQIQAGAGSLAATLLAQNVQVTQAELNAMNKLIRTLRTTNITPGQAYLNFFKLQTNFAKANVALQVVQNQELTTGTIIPFAVKAF